ncbi:MAG: GHKL domain-containing protein [Desulfobacterales bacterium]|nr:GHKL domain-containing protein [Desulfobacterales bacterium]
MKNKPNKHDNEFDRMLKWIMFTRVLFATFLLSSIIFIRLRENSPPLSTQLIFLYELTAGILVISFIYSITFKFLNKKIIFAYIQILIDTFIVSLMLYATGGFSSFFLFLYLVVIIYSSMLLFRRGSMLIASLCSIQYGILVNLEYYKILIPLGLEDDSLIANYSIGEIVYKVFITIISCFAVSFLSSLLSEQERKTKKELIAMENHLKRVEKMALIGEMAAGMAHEIKNPLASLTGSIQILREDSKFDPDYDRLMQIIIREADRLNSLLSDFLMFAKPQTGKSETLDLSEALDEIIELFEKNITCRDKITIIKDYTTNIFVEIDPIHLRQIIWNLLLNSSEAVSKKGLIEIKTSKLKNTYALLEIIDNGCGMSKETMKSIFDPFFTTKKNGTGLGLSIVHRILESYNCWIDVKSDIGQGTTFSLSLKLSNLTT